jgi:hypothetical protein
VQDEYLGDSDDPELVQSDVAVWFQPASDREVTMYQRRDQVVTHKAYFRGNPGVRPGYLLIPADGPHLACPFTGSIMEVKSSNETTAGIGLLWAVMCEERQQR